MSCGTPVSHGLMLIGEIELYKEYFQENYKLTSLFAVIS